MSKTDIDKYYEGKIPITAFGTTRLCKVRHYGKVQQCYPKDRIMWIVRPEDWYGFHHFKEPFCVVEEEDFRKGEDL